MRTTLTLDDDVAVRLKRLQDADELSFKEAVNTALRRGLEVMERKPTPSPLYRLDPADLGEARFSLDSVADALADAEGDAWV